MLMSIGNKDNKDVNPNESQNTEQTHQWRPIAIVMVLKLNKPFSTHTWIIFSKPRNQRWTKKGNRKRSCCCTKESTVGGNRNRSHQQVAAKCAIAKDPDDTEDKTAVGPSPGEAYLTNGWSKNNRGWTQTTIWEDQTVSIEGWYLWHHHIHRCENRRCRRYKNSDGCRRRRHC